MRNENAGMADNMTQLVGMKKSSGSTFMAGVFKIKGSRYYAWIW